MIKIFKHNIANQLKLTLHTGVSEFTGEGHSIVKPGAYLVTQRAVHEKIVISYMRQSGYTQKPYEYPSPYDQCLRLSLQVINTPIDQVVFSKKHMTNIMEWIDVIFGEHKTGLIIQRATPESNAFQFRLFTDSEWNPIPMNTLPECMATHEWKLFREVTQPRDSPIGAEAYEDETVIGSV